MLKGHFFHCYNIGPQLPPAVAEPHSLPAECFIETPCTRSCGDGFKLLLPNPTAYGCYGATLQVSLPDIVC
jgi:hypothetical protein